MPGNTSDEVARKINRAKAIELKQAGASYRQISEQLHVSLRTAHRYVMTELTELAKESQAMAMQVRAIEAQRLDRLHLALWKRAVDGDLGAVYGILKVMERRAKLLGLDAPQQVEVGGSMEIVQVFAQAQASLAAKLANLPVIDITPQLAALSTGGDNGNGHH